MTSIPETEQGNELAAEYRQGRPLLKCQFPEFVCPFWEVVAWALVHLTALGLTVALMPVAPLIAALILTAGLALFLLWLRRLAHRSAQSGLRLLLFRNGLVLVPRQGRVWHLPWEEIELRSLRQGLSIAPENAPPLCTIPATLPWAVAAGTLLQQLSSRQMIRRQMRRLYQGEEIRFGPLTVCPEGMTLGQRYLPWELVDCVAQDQTRLTVLCRGQRRPWAVLPRERVPNLVVLQYVCDHYRARETQPFEVTSPGHPFAVAR